MNSLGDDRKRFDYGTLKGRQTVRQWHATTDIDDHSLGHRSIAMKTKNLLFAAIVRASATATAAARITATTHWDNTHNIAEVKSADTFGIGAKSNNPTTGFVADGSWPLDPGEIWLARARTVVRSANAHVYRLDDDFTLGWLGQGNAFDGQITRDKSARCARVDIFGSVEPKGSDGVSHDLLSFKSGTGSGILNRRF
jgi:hypothetical protein